MSPLEEPFNVSGLTITVEEVWREPGPPERDRLVARVEARNPVRPLGQHNRPPMVEAHDGQGRVYPLIPDDAWLEPVRPDSAITSRLEFDIAHDATDIVLMFDPESTSPMPVEIVGS